MESDSEFQRITLPLLVPAGYLILRIVNNIKELGFIKKGSLSSSVVESLTYFDNFSVFTCKNQIRLPIKTPDNRVLIVLDNYTHKEIQGLSYEIIKTGSTFKMEHLLKMLVDLDYTHVDYVEKAGEFSKRGGILDIFPYTEPHPVRLEFFGDRVEGIRIFREDTQKTIRKINSLYIPGNTSKPQIVEFIPEEKTVSYVKPLPLRYADFKELISAMNHYITKGYRVLFYTIERERGKRYSEILPAEIHIGLIEEGFVDEEQKIAVFTELMLFPLYRKRRKVRHTRTEIKRTFQKGEYVVHLDYGIARFDGLIRCRAFGKEYDCARLIFRDGYLDVPTHNFHLIERFNIDRENVHLSYLSRETWKKRRLRIEIKAYKLARDILKIHAQRKKLTKKPYPPVSEIEERIALDFPYIETEDQKRAIEDVLRDLESPNLMDRLIAGDVGFGKTEVAIRACARVVANSRQVLLLVPTTPLALQHYNLFKKRLEKYGISVRMASRFASRKELERIAREVKEGKCDILISTHYVLRREIEFKNLGLLIIDEEHKFGVKDKEILRKKYPAIDTLRLTATPIPRTLNMSLGKIYDLSIIETPPLGREAVKTYVGPVDEKIIKEAILFELNRGGKVFYIHNRIHDIHRVEERLKKLLPEIKIQVAHGRLSPLKLEKILMDFYTGDTDVLLSTAIMETGVDFPRANTIIIENAHLFGLADLHQLRGRVGRGDTEGYAYFLVPRKISKNALKRLDTIKRYHHLGAGFQIALKDMEIRGAGNLLGKEQHGFIETVGPSMFFKLLEMAISELEGKKHREIDLMFSEKAYIPESYIEDDTTRIGFYTQLSEAKSLKDLEKISMELKDRFGPLPDELQEFLYGMSLKILFREHTDVIFINVSKNNVTLKSPRQGTLTLSKLTPEKLLNLYLEIVESQNNT